MQECEVWAWRPWRGLCGPHKHLDRFRQRSEERLLAGHAEEEPTDMSKCRQTSPHPNLLGKQEGKHAFLSLMARH